jgi:hypothetical protein
MPEQIAVTFPSVIATGNLSDLPVIQFGVKEKASQIKIAQLNLG